MLDSFAGPLLILNCASTRRISKIAANNVLSNCGRNFMSVFFSYMLSMHVAVFPQSGYDPT